MIDADLRRAAEKAAAALDEACGVPAPWREGYVYVLGSPASELVKIGKAQRPGERLADIQRMSPVPLELVGLLHGAAAEGIYHSRFADDREHGEWFKRSAVAQLLHDARLRALEGLPCFGCVKSPMDVDRLRVQRWLTARTEWRMPEIGGHGQWARLFERDGDGWKMCDSRWGGDQNPLVAQTATGLGQHPAATLFAASARWALGGDVHSLLYGLVPGAGGIFEWTWNARRVLPSRLQFPLGTVVGADVVPDILRLADWVAERLGERFALHRFCYHFPSITMSAEAAAAADADRREQGTCVCQATA